MLSTQFPRKRCMKLALATAASVALLITLESHAYHWVNNFLDFLPLDSVFSTVRQFPSLAALLTLITIIHVFDAPRKKAVVYLLVALAINGLTGELVKHATGRARPKYAVDMREDNVEKIEKWLVKYPGVRLTTEPRDQWLMGSPNRFWFNSNYASFPSNHSSAAFVLAVFLAALYPRGTRLWYWLAIGCALSRIESEMHYPSDCIMGAFQGWAIAQWTLTFAWPVRLAESMPWWRESPSRVTIQPVPAEEFQHALASAAFCYAPSDSNNAECA